MIKNLKTLESFLSSNDFMEYIAYFLLLLIIPFLALKIFDMIYYHIRPLAYRFYKGESVLNFSDSPIYCYYQPCFFYKWSILVPLSSLSLYIAVKSKICPEVIKSLIFIVYLALIVDVFEELIVHSKIIRISRGKVPNPLREFTLLLIIKALIIWISFAFLYHACATISGENFFVDSNLSKINALKDCFYFSLTTLTTTGLGDIIPNTNIAKLFTVSQIAISWSLAIIMVFQYSVVISSNTIKPCCLLPLKDNIPNELIKKPQWIVWRARYDKVKGKWIKITFNPKNGKFAKPNDQKTWCEFDKAWEVYSTWKYDGIGFMLSEADNFCSITFEHSVNLDNFEFDSALKGHTDKLDTYLEYTPLGDGIRAIFECTNSFKNKKKENIEFLYKGNFIAITGHYVHDLSDAPSINKKNDDDINHIRKEIFGRE